jgi:Na+-transporting NADH:ubiquinone oxidoreductase subunit B
VVFGEPARRSVDRVLPFWIAAVGIIVAISFGKEFFGGFGRNVFNPAIVGRAFLYVCFPVVMTRGFVPVYAGGAGGLLHWGARTSVDGIDAVTAATPMWVMRDHGFVTPLWRLVTGVIEGQFAGTDGTHGILAAGSIGEVSAILVLIGGIYLLWTKTANWRLVVSSLAGSVAAVLVFRYALGAALVPPVPWSLCSGALLYACFFMVTDPVSAPNDRTTQYIYGALIGALIIFMRWRAVFAGAVGFAILLGNTIGPSIEMYFKARARKAKARQKAKSKAAA